MRCLRVVLLALAPIAASGQAVESMQIQSWSFSSFGGWSSMRSSSSSVAWGLGSDGQMHEEVHNKESSKTYGQDDSVQKEMHSKVDCIDGLCQKQMVGMLGGGAASAAPRSARMQRLLDLMGITRSSPSLRGASAVPVQVIAPQSPTVVVVPAVAPAASVTISHPTPQQLLRGPLHQAAPAAPTAEMQLISRAAFTSMGFMLLAGILSLLMKSCRERSQAREVPLRAALAEPLASGRAPTPTATRSAAPADKAEAVKEDAAATAREAAKTYLASLYSETTMPTKAYLMRVYANILA